MLKRTENDMSCASFEIANASTLVYWMVIFWTSDPVKLGWRKAAHKTLHQGLYVFAAITIVLSKQAFYFYLAG